jgi:hypothetical protein
MPNSYTQEIPRFSKLNPKHFCAIAYASKDIANFCRHFFFLMMNRYNVVVCETPITSVIHQLTGWEKDSIKKAINRLASDGEIELIGRKSVRINDLIANKLPFVKNHNGYAGHQPSYSEAQCKVIEDLERIIPTHPNLDRKDYDMKQLFKKLDQQEEELTKMQVKLDRILQATDFLMSRAKGEDVEEVKKLYLVRDSEHD